MSFHDTRFHQPTYGKHMSPDFEKVMQDLQRDGEKAEEVDIVEVRTGSDSDFSKIQPFLDELQAKNIPYILRILSAHRTADEMLEGAEAFPNELLPEAIRNAIDISKLRVKLCVAAAWGAAHIAGMTAVAAAAAKSKSHTTVLALPVSWSAMWRIDAMLSMLNMPPGVPNGFVNDNEMAAKIAQKLYELQLSSDDNRVSFWNKEQMPEMSEKDKQLMHSLGLVENDEAKVSIHTQELGDEAIPSDDNYNIVIPTVFEKTAKLTVLMKIFNKGLNSEWVYMWVQREKSLSNTSDTDTWIFAGVRRWMNKFLPSDKTEVTISYTNAIIHAAQILANTNPSIKRRLDGYREQLAREVKRKDTIAVAEQLWLMTPLKEQLLNSGLWPMDKEITFEKGEPKLEELWYELFYRWKNADLYLVPDSEPMQIIEYRTDRKSVFDIPLDLEIEWTWEVQTEISNLAARFIEDLWLKYTWIYKMKM